MEELGELVSEYLENHPGSQTPLNLFSSHGVDEIIDIIKNSRGREILISSDDKKLDKTSWRYGPAV